MGKVILITPSRVPHPKVVQFIETGIFSLFQLVDKETKKNELLKRKCRANTPLPSNAFFSSGIVQEIIACTHTYRHTETQFSYILPDNIISHWSNRTRVNTTCETNIVFLGLIGVNLTKQNLMLNLCHAQGQQDTNQSLESVHIIPPLNHHFLH